MSTDERIYPLAAARALALHAQQLTEPMPQGAELPGEKEIFSAVARLGCVQIDTLHVVERSHYLVLWSRLGNYDKADFEGLIYDGDKRCLFEGWQHAACFIPLRDYNYQKPRMKHLQQKQLEPGKWYAEPENQELCRRVYKRIETEGPLRARDFEYDGPKRGSWWDWKPAKNALELLYAFGDLMISGRENFQRIYDLRERVLPDWVEREVTNEEERDRYWLEQGVLALGICEALQAADYSYRKRNSVRGYIQDMVGEGIFSEVKVRLHNGDVKPFIIHSKNRDLLEKAAAGEILPRRTTFLSPFDNLFWARNRDSQLWDFRNLLEAYKPAPTRKWGYFNMPILYRDQLVGRIDPKVVRKNGKLIIKGFFLEEGVELHEDLSSGLAGAFRSFMDFHQANELVFERKEDAWSAERIIARL